MRLLLILFYISAIITFIACDENTPTDIKPNDGKPLVKILTPINNSVIAGIIPIKVEATDDKGIVKVEIYIDGAVKKEFTVPPYDYDWNTQFEQDSSLHIVYAKAYDADENIASTAVINVITRSLAQPQLLTYTIVNDENINLQWGYINPNNYSFVIEESVNNQAYTQIMEIPNGITIANINRMIKRDTVYSYQVKAKQGNFYSPAAKTPYFTIQIPVPQNVKCNLVSTNSAKITWIDGCSYETFYRIEKKEGGGDFYLLQNVGPNTQEFIDNNYNPVINVIYRIKTITKYNESDPIIAAVTVAGEPLVMNEFFSRGFDPDFDWIEIYNPNTVAVSLTGYKIYDGGGYLGTKPKLEFPTDAIILPNGFYVIVVDIQNPSGFGLGSGGDECWLEKPDGTVIDNQVIPAMPVVTTSYCRVPDGSTNWMISNTITKGAPNQP